VLYLTLNSYFSTNLIYRFNTLVLQYTSASLYSKRSPFFRKIFFFLTVLEFELRACSCKASKLPLKQCLQYLQGYKYLLPLFSFPKRILFANSLELWKFLGHFGAHPHHHECSSSKMHLKCQTSFANLSLIL
jgi:hypothetical protein